MYMVALLQFIVIPNGSAEALNPLADPVPTV